MKILMEFGQDRSDYALRRFCSLICV